MRIAALSALLLLVAGCGSSTTQGAGTPRATVRPTTSTERWSHPPKMTINPNRTYRAIVSTSDGTFTITLLPRVAPITVNNFVFLAEHHFYDHVTFHRIIRAFMVQTGDPTGTGAGGPGYKFKDEPVHQRYTVGTVAMANSGPNTNGSQFFIVTGPDGLGLQPKYTVFGRVTSGMNVVKKIAATPVGPNVVGELSQPLTDVYINHITIQS